MIIYEVSTSENDHYGYCEYYIDHKFYFLKENADKDLNNRLEDGENAVLIKRYVEDEK